MRIQAMNAAYDLRNRRLDGVDLTRHRLFHCCPCLLKSRAASPSIPSSSPTLPPPSCPFIRSTICPPPSCPVISSTLLSVRHCRVQVFLAGVHFALDESLRARQVLLRLLELPYRVVALPDHLSDALFLQGCRGFEIVDMLLQRNLALVRRPLFLEVGHLPGFEVGLEH